MDNVQWAAELVHPARNKADSLYSIQFAFTSISSCIREDRLHPYGFKIIQVLTISALPSSAS